VIQITVWTVSCCTGPLSGPDCDHIRGGRNHRAGLQQAPGTTRELAGDWIDHAHEAGQDISHVVPATAALHEPLFAATETGPEVQR